jgi:hypothetical protein
MVRKTGIDRKRRPRKGKKRVKCHEAFVSVRRQRISNALSYVVNTSGFPP